MNKIQCYDNRKNLYKAKEYRIIRPKTFSYGIQERDHVGQEWRTVRIYSIFKWSVKLKVYGLRWSNYLKFHCGR